MTQAAAGTLPSVAFIDACFGKDGPDGDDEHPPADVQIGQAFVSDVVQRARSSNRASKGDAIGRS